MWLWHSAANRFLILFLVFLSSKVYLLPVCVKHAVQANQQHQIIDEIVAHQHTICRWDSAIRVHTDWIKWAPNHLWEIRDIHIDSVEVDFDLFLLYSLLDERDTTTLTPLAYAFTLTSKYNIAIKVCFAPINRDNFAFAKLLFRFAGSWNFGAFRESWNAYWSIEIVWFSRTWKNKTNGIHH